MAPYSAQEFDGTLPRQILLHKLKGRGAPFCMFLDRNCWPTRGGGTEAARAAFVIEWNAAAPPFMWKLLERNTEGLLWGEEGSTAGLEGGQLITHHRHTCTNTHAYSVS